MVKTITLLKAAVTFPLSIRMKHRRPVVRIHGYISTRTEVLPDEWHIVVKASPEVIPIGASSLPGFSSDSHASTRKQSAFIRNSVDANPDRNK